MPTADRIRAQCQHCGQVMHAHPDFLGRTASCPTCSESIVVTEYSADTPPPPPTGWAAQPSDTKTCPYCAETIKAAASVCRYCGQDLYPRSRRYRSRNRDYDSHPGVAGVLSLVWPGAGQIYQGRVGLGLVWMFATFIGYLMLIVPGLLLHVICIVHAASYRGDD